MLNNKFMEEALIIAKNADEDIPVGALIVCNGKIISSACNMREKNNDITAHAEILALEKAAKVLNNWRLENCDLYVTLEPCPMCTWAILQSRIKSVYFGSYDLKYGAFVSAVDLRKYSDVKPNVYGGILEQECDELISEFWKQKRI